MCCQKFHRLLSRTQRGHGTERVRFIGIQIVDRDKDLVSHRRTKGDLYQVYRLPLILTRVNKFVNKWVRRKEIIDGYTIPLLVWNEWQKFLLQNCKYKTTETDITTLILFFLSNGVVRDPFCSLTKWEG